MKKLLQTMTALGLVGLLVAPLPASAACRALTCLGGLLQADPDVPEKIHRYGGAACNNNETKTFFHTCGYVEECDDDDCYIVLDASATRSCRKSYLSSACITPESATKDAAWVTAIGGSKYGAAAEITWSDGNSITEGGWKCPGSAPDTGCYVMGMKDDD
ncbi:MAG: hypothetical protein PHS57_00800 [Alphaproteobacteria bacterium]|nr:hypothetical protein [Alphaproteobacteria bacterium]